MHKPKEKTVYLAVSITMLTICALAIIIPIMIVFMSSVSDESTVIKYGYTSYGRRNSALKRTITF